MFPSQATRPLLDALNTTCMTSLLSPWVSVVATAAHVDADRQRLREENELLRFQLRISSAKAEALTTRVHELTEHNASIRVALHAVLHLQRVVDGGRHDTDDDEEWLLELYELRRWKQRFAVEQTRSLVDRVDALTAHVHRLEHVNKEREEARVASA